MRLFLFWLLYFALFRLCFVVFNFNHFESSSLAARFNIFIYGIRLDLSAAAYCIIFPFVLLSISIFITNDIFRKLNLWYHYVLIFIINMVCVSNIVLYKYWHALISKRALDFLRDPLEIFASLNTMQIVILIIVYFILFIGFRKLFLRIVNDKFPDVTLSLIKKSIAVIASVFILFYCARGGLQLIPINESACYFSEKIEENHAAINPAWYLIRNLQLADRAGENPYNFYDDAIAHQKFVSLFATQNDITTRLLNNAKPNIVILILESHTADVIGSLGGDSDNSPNLDRIINEDALTFTQCYSSGFRTDQMLPSVFSGFPSQPNNSISRHDDKIQKLPHLPLIFKQRGYHTSFYYAGEMGFANMKSFLINSGFEKLVDKSIYSSDQLNSKWGAHDEFSLKILLNDLNQSSQPFFASMLTITLHEPFEITSTPKYTGNTEAVKFKNAAYYTDSCLGGFFNEAKKQAWYDNTLFILVADHGHHLPRERDIYDPYTHRIPLIFTGGALSAQYKGKRFNRTTNQNDLPAILLNQLNINSDSFTFSKNTLNENTNAFAYLCYDDGFTWVTDSCAIHYSQAQNKAEVVSKCINENQQKENAINGKVFLQVLYETFLKM